MFHADKAFQIQRMQYEEAATRAAKQHTADERPKSIGESLLHKARTLMGLQGFSARIQ